MYAVWARRIERIERNIDRAASALLASACGYAVFVWFRLTARPPFLAAEVAAAAAGAYLLGIRALGGIKPATRKPPVPIFDVREVEPIDPVEDRPTTAVAALEPVAALVEALAAVGMQAPLETVPPEDAPAEDARPEAGEEALVLDDILAELGPDSRVVRLFDAKSMPTAGELQSRIDRHLDGEMSAAQTSDASQALHEALAELRRSIR
jgi:hypothetical protein